MQHRHQSPRKAKKASLVRAPVATKKGVCRRTSHRNVGRGIADVGHRASIMWCRHLEMHRPQRCGRGQGTRRTRHRRRTRHMGSRWQANSTKARRRRQYRQQCRQSLHANPQPPQRQKGGRVTTPRPGIGRTITAKAHCGVRGYTPMC